MPTSPIPPTHSIENATKVLIPYGVSFLPDIIVSANGVFLTTSTGRQLLDWTSGQMACILGHGNEEVAATIQTHTRGLGHLLSASISPPVVELATRLVSLLPIGLDRAMFLSTGSESCEAAIKLAKVFTGKWEIVGLGSSWHGMTGAAVSAQYHGGRKGFGPLMPGNLCLPAPNAYRSIFRTADGSYDWDAELAYGWEMIDRVSSGSLAAVILEPILASGGMITLPCGYLKAMKAYCEARGMLLILDEAQTGLGRGGTMFAFEHEGVVPDILTLSKTLGGGMPLSAVVTSEEIATTCAERGFLFCTTHVNDPLPAAVGVTVLEVVMRGGLVERARVAGERLHAGLRALQARYGCIGDVRGRGMFAGLEIVDDRVQKTPAPRVAEALSERMFELGLSTNLLRMGSHERVFRLAPPLVMTDAQIDMGLELMEEALRTTEGTLPLLS